MRCKMVVMELETLERWCKEYGIERTTIEVVNAWITQHTIGITYFKKSVLPG